MQRGLNQRGLKFAGAAGIGFLALVSFAGSEAQATEGYFQYGWGARQGALGGAGVADSREARRDSLSLLRPGVSTKRGAGGFGRRQEERVGGRLSERRP